MIEAGCTEQRSDREVHRIFVSHFSGEPYAADPLAEKHCPQTSGLLNLMFKIIEADLSKPGHADALIDLLDCYARDPMGGGAGLSQYARANIGAALMEREGCSVILAYEASRPIGLLIAFEGFSTFACRPLLNIHDIVVMPEFRGRGIVSLLLREAERIARECGCCKLTLEVLEGNESAMKAYSRYGFVNYQLDPVLGRAMFLEKQL